MIEWLIWDKQTYYHVFIVPFLDVPTFVSLDFSTLKHFCRTRKQPAMDTASYFNLSVVLMKTVSYNFFLYILSNLKSKQDTFLSFIALFLLGALL